MPKIEAPSAGYNGTGPGGAVFVDGVGETDDPAALNYYRAAGYIVDGDREVVVDEVVDSRDLPANLVVGTPLRDAAVDPDPSDFLPPINAGREDPHGDKVVSPEVHASGPAGIRPGEVHVDDVKKQDERESAFAEARLIDQLPAAVAVAAEIPDTEARGELGLSDPGSAEAGRVEADEADEDKPAKSDSKDSWVDWAVNQGADRGEAEDTTKADLIRTYG